MPLEYVCVPAKSCLTLCSPMNCSLPGSSVYGIFKARILEQVAVSYSGVGGVLPEPEMEESLVSPALAGRLFTTSTTWEALRIHKSI